MFAYRCVGCDILDEAEKGDEQIICQQCGKPLSRIYNFGGVSFKGDGFYKTDKDKT